MLWLKFVGQFMERCRHYSVPTAQGVFSNSSALLENILCIVFKGNLCKVHYPVDSMSCSLQITEIRSIFRLLEIILFHYRTDKFKLILIYKFQTLNIIIACQKYHIITMSYDIHVEKDISTFNFIEHSDRSGFKKYTLNFPTFPIQK